MFGAVGTPGVSRTANPLSVSPAPLLAQLPVKSLLVVARSSSHRFSRLYSALLRLLATHLPHLCLALDWLAEEEGEFSSPAEVHELSLPADRAWLGALRSDLVQESGGGFGSGFGGWLKSSGHRGKGSRLPTPEQLSKGVRERKRMFFSV